MLGTQFSMRTELWLQVPVTTGMGGIRVWRVSLDFLDDETLDGSSRLTWLTQDELERAKRYHFERDRDRFVASRIALRLLLGSVLGMDPAAVSFSFNPFGKPSLAGQCAGRLHFNVAHSDGLMVCALSERTEVGVDVERIREVPEAEGIIDTHFPNEVRASWRRLPVERRAEEFLRLWVRHEAHLKCSGTGLAGAEHALPVRGDKSVIEFVPADGFVGAVVF